MFDITDIARDNLKELCKSDSAKAKELVVYFQGHGWSGPNLGMALEESTDGLEKVESNSISLYLDAKLKDFLEQSGTVTIDFQSYPSGGGGYIITVGDGCDTSSCGGSC